MDTAGEPAPATVEQVGAAMAALGAYSGTNSPAEHAAEAARLGGPDAYRVRLVNALLGAVQAQAILADQVDLPAERRDAAWEEQLAGVAGPDPIARMECLRWQVLRAATPLRLIAQHPETGPIPLAAAHAANGLHLLIGAIAASQGAVATGDVETLAGQGDVLREARESLTDAIANVDLLLDLLRSVGL